MFKATGNTTCLHSAGASERHWHDMTVLFTVLLLFCSSNNPRGMDLIKSASSSVQGEEYCKMPQFVFVIVFMYSDRTPKQCRQVKVLKSPIL